MNFNIRNFFSRIKEKINSIQTYDMHGYKNKRKFMLTVASLIVIGVLAVSFFAGGMFKARSLTGLVVQQEQELDQLKINLTSTGDELTIKNEELTSKQEEINEGQKELATKEAELVNLQQQILSKESEASDYRNTINNLKDESSDLRRENENLREGSENLIEAIESSAWSLCCSFNDFKEGNQEDWEIVDGVIECSGEYSIDCGDGSTNFDGNIEEEE